MISYYVMTRSGEFAPARHTPNQCKVEGHDRYHYELRMCFLGDMQLDKDQFILDHQLIDNLIQNLALRGSCEEMHKLIHDQLNKLMTRRVIPMVACRCRITPIPAGLAFLDFAHAVDQHLHTLSLVA